MPLLAQSPLAAQGDVNNDGSVTPLVGENEDPVSEGCTLVGDISECLVATFSCQEGPDHVIVTTEGDLGMSTEVQGIERDWEHTDLYLLTF